MSQKSVENNIGMTSDAWYDRFLKALSAKYPKKSQLAEELMSLLHIEREAVYRRLRKNMAFQAHEMAKIASAWNISLDEIIDIRSGKISFQMQPMDYIHPSDQDEYYLQTIVQDIFRISNFADTEYMEICNRVPRSLLAGYSHLNQFYLFRWAYQYGSKEEAVLFSHVIISEKQRKLTEDYYLAMKQIPDTNFILDYKLFENLAGNIQYFHSIRLITDEEKKLIKKDLQDLLNYLSEVASKGYYPETKNKVNLYISQLSVDTNYSYTYSKEVKVCFVHVFDKYEVYTLNPEMVADFITWMKLKKRTSVQISGVDEKRRVSFFERQQQIIDNL